jgi:ketosteroid isomerase-like protein
VNESEKQMRGALEACHRALHDKGAVAAVAHEVGDDVAFAHTRTRTTGTKTDGEKVDARTRTTLGLIRGGSEWTIGGRSAAVT